MTQANASRAETPSRPGIWHRPLEAARANLLPGLVLQAFALALILAYYFHPPTHHALDAVAAFKERTGYLYSFFATGIFGGVIPFLYLRLHPATRRVTPASHGLFLVLFWAYKGIEVDAFYRLQGVLWGNGIDFATVTCKILLDLFVYCPVWATPGTMLVFHWKEAGFSFAAIRRLDLPDFLRRNLLTTLMATWSVWLPAVAIIYCLPPPLQIPLFNIVLCFFSLLFATLTRKRRE